MEGPQPSNWLCTGLAAPPSLLKSWKRGTQRKIHARTCAEKCESGPSAVGIWMWLPHDLRCADGSINFNQDFPAWDGHCVPRDGRQNSGHTTWSAREPTDHLLPNCRNIVLIAKLRGGATRSRCRSFCNSQCATLDHVDLPILPK